MTATLLPTEVSGHRSAVEQPDHHATLAASRGQVGRDIEACLTNITACDPGIGAWAYIGAAQARAQARLLDACVGRVGELHGVPIGVKDVIATRDMPTGYGRSTHYDEIPSDDAMCVRRARAAGAVVVGKTATAEFALSAPPGTRHPYARMRSPGGSSAGSAAAVAAGMIPLALATQTGGSAIRPASYCGVVGFKPSFGLIDRAGALPLSPSFDTIAVIGRTVDWAARFVSVIGNAIPLRPVFRGGLVVGLYMTETTSGASPHPLVAAALAAAAEAFASTGATVRRIEPHGEDAALCVAHNTIVLSEARHTLSAYLANPTSRLRAATRRVFAAPPASFPDVSAAHGQAARARRNIEQWFGDADLLLAPAVVGPAPRRGSSGDPTPCIVWTLLHLPCLTLPTCVTDDNGLRIGVQLIARHSDDALLISAARSLEGVLRKRALHWCDDGHA